MTNSVNTINNSKEVKKSDFSKMSEQELITQLQSGKLTKEEMVNVGVEIAKKNLEKTGEKSSTMETIKEMNLKYINKGDLKKLLDTYLQEYNQKNIKNLKQGSNVAVKKLHIEDLMAQLNDEKESHEETKEKYDKLLMADEKLI